MNLVLFEDALMHLPGDLGSQDVTGWQWKMVSFWMIRLRIETYSKWIKYDCLVLTGTMEFYDFPETVGNGITSQLTFTPSFFRGVGQPPTRITW